MPINDFKQCHFPLMRYWMILAVIAFILDPQIVHSQTKTSQNGVPELQARIKQLEVQVSDLQVIIGTLESLVKQGGAMSAGSAAGNLSDPGRFGTQIGASGGLADRIEGLETQIQAISGQLERLAANVDNLSRNSIGGGVGRQGSLDNNSDFSGQSEEGQIVASPLRDMDTMTTESVDGGFGRMSVEPNSTRNNPSQQRPGNLNQNSPLREGQTGFPQQSNSQSRIASLGEEGPKAIYDAAYGHLLGRDYASAESAFKEFLKRYPQDRLAGNAQYWLGETFYVRGNYREAADNFLKGYSKYRSNRKAPESLLKLAMSLKKLGQKEAACATFDELNAKYPKLDQRVRQRANFEHRNAGC